MEISLYKVTTLDKGFILESIGQLLINNTYILDISVDGIVTTIITIIPTKTGNIFIDSWGTSIPPSLSNVCFTLNTGGECLPLNCTLTIT